MTEQTVRLSIGQAIVRYLTHQYTERDGVERHFIRGVFGIFGHGNATGLGQALLQNEVAPDDEEGRLEYWMGRNEQGMVHACSAYAHSDSDTNGDCHCGASNTYENPDAHPDT